MQFVKHTTLGFDREHVVVLERTHSFGNQQQAFRERVLQTPGVQAAAFARQLPGMVIGDNAMYASGKSSRDMESIRAMQAGYGLAETLDLQMAKGRYFIPGSATDSAAVVLNQKAVQVFGLTDPIGAQVIEPGLDINEPGVTYTVIGVLEDFHFESLHRAIDPLAIYLRPAGDFLIVRLEPGNAATRLEALQAAWDSFGIGTPFTYSFLDARYDALYGSEQRIGQLFAVFSSLAILIACLGLMGLAAFMAQKRTKELGIRKVLGATAPNLVMLLSKDFTRLVVIAFLIAAPISWIAMRQWLNGFAYHIDVAWWLLPVAGLLALLIAWLSVGYQSVRAALAEPVKSLRYE
jgi:putative ABC transport system permease protein